MRDSARELADKAEKEKDKLEAQAQESKRLAEELQQKLDALIAIERELRSRPPGETSPGEELPTDLADWRQRATPHR